MARETLTTNVGPLIARVYAYVAYHVGDRHEAEDVTSDVFERAMRYRASFDPAKGNEISWLLGIARRCVADRQRLVTAGDAVEHTGESEFEAAAVERLDLQRALGQLDDRSRELIALRYGADLRAREIAAVVGMQTNAVEVALHRALARLRASLQDEARTRPRESEARAKPSVSSA